ncbi:hypothetical protein EYF80_047213 [Liparis tanakae]|uniref:Uncharacterized protein n=1 Tax=Liparis tanakae TaxID=230148 RepID=A0A4Z2FNH8_9TELE|nr:hypothetical protein EYF80_047213 [Liparis tanakae]
MRNRRRIGQLRPGQADRSTFEERDIAVDVPPKKKKKEKKSVICFQLCTGTGKLLEHCEIASCNNECDLTTLIFGTAEAADTRVNRARPRYLRLAWRGTSDAKL